MKKILSIILFVFLVMNMSLPVFAAGNNANVSENCELISSEEHNISYDDYIQTLAKAKNISLKEAIDYDKNQNIGFQKEKGVQGNGIVPYTEGLAYKYVSYTFAYNKNPDFKANLQATIKLYGDYNYYDIVAVDVYSRAADGTGNNTWHELTAWSDPEGGSYPTSSVTLGASGYFEVAVVTSGSVGIDIPGFSVSGSSGGTTYLRSETMNMLKTYSLY